MAIATDYPFLDVLWTIMVVFAWVAYIWLLIVIFGDLFSRRDISGWGKAAWVVFLIVLPFLGVLSYLIVQHDGMAERSAKRAQDSQQQVDAYIKSVAGGDGAASEIEKAKHLLDTGAINQSDYETLKQRALARH